MDSTWGTNEVKWYFDCYNDDGSKLTQIEQKPTSLDQLQKYLFEQYDNTVAPANLNRIYLHFGVDIAAFDAKKSMLATKGRIKAVMLPVRAYKTTSSFLYFCGMFYRCGLMLDFVGSQKITIMYRYSL